jgi:hypothetical protein
VVEYPVRTPVLYWVLAVAACALAVPLAGLGLFALAMGRWGEAALFLVFAATFVAYVASTAEYRVAAGAIRLSPHFVEVPAGRGAWLRFDARETAITTTKIVVRYRMGIVPMGDVERGHVIDLRSKRARRRISTLLLVHRWHETALLDDLGRVARGEAPLGPVGDHRARPGPPGSRDRYDDELDRELAALDD